MAFNLTGVNADPGVFTEHHNRVYASGIYNSELPMINNAIDLNNEAKIQ